MFSFGMCKVLDSVNRDKTSLEIRMSSKITYSLVIFTRYCEKVLNNLSSAKRKIEE